MKKFVVGYLAVSVFLVFSLPAYAGEEKVYFNFGVYPVGIIYAPDVDGFSATKGFYTEEIEGTVGYVPGGYLGMDFDTGSSGIGVDVFGSSITASDAVEGVIYGANVSYILPHGDSSFLLRLKGGAVKGSLDWKGSYTTVEFEDASGWQAGIASHVGRKVGFYWEVLYRELEFDVDTKHSDITNRNSLDMSGVVVNAGVGFRF